MKGILLIAATLVFSPLAAQQQNFDIVRYTPPKGWKQESSAGALQLSKENTTDGSYCIITVFKSLPASATPKANFEATWETVVKEMVKVSGQPEMQPVAKEDGWEAHTGYAPFESEGQKGVALLVTSSGYEKMVNILVLTNTNSYETELTGFLGSVSLTKPSAGRNLGARSDNTPGNTTSQVSKPASNGYAFNMINFDDGWTSTIYDDYVLVTKTSTKVYLLFPVPYDASGFSGTGVVERDYYWDNYVTKYFTIVTKQYQDNGEYIGSFKPRYVEGWAKNKQSGEKEFIAMTLSIAPNAAYIIIAATPDEAALRRQFPKANEKYNSDLAAMSGYNRFAIGKNDLIGKWSSSGGGTMSWYSTTTGQNAGATGVVSSHVFQFNPNYTYTSEHKGATGWVGSMNTYQQKYNGAYTVSKWQVTLSKRWDGKTETFTSWFEAFKGGRVLHLDSKSISYSLFKEN